MDFEQFSIKEIFILWLTVCAVPLVMECVIDNKSNIPFIFMGVKCEIERITCFEELWGKMLPGEYLNYRGS